MKLLHTGDWHVGKAIRGRSRLDEHEAVLREIAWVADTEDVDAVLVAGDLFDAAAPTPDAERAVYGALLALSSGGRRPVLVVGGNHDSPARLEAVAPVFAAHGVRIVARPTRPVDGGVVSLDTPGGPLRVGMLPFPSQRVAATVDDLMAHDAADHTQSYSGRVHNLLEVVSSSFDADAVNVVLAHLMVMGGTMGGGERSAHTVFEYWVPTNAFPATAHYVALGHLHRAQQLEGPSPVHYAGSPLQLDFGETANEPSVNLVVAEPGRAGVEVRGVPLSSGRRLRTLRGTPDELLATDVASVGDDHLRLVVDSGPRPGLADELRARFPAAVEVALAARVEPAEDPAAVPCRAGRTPHELFEDYLEQHDAADARVLALFDELVGEVVEA
jgi:exonuclease SbcD